MQGDSHRSFLWTQRKLISTAENFLAPAAVTGAASRCYLLAGTEGPGGLRGTRP